MEHAVAVLGRLIDLSATLAGFLILVLVLWYNRSSPREGSSRGDFPSDLPVPSDPGVANFKVALVRWRQILVWGVGVPMGVFIWWPVIEDMLPRENVTGIVMLSSSLLLGMLVRAIYQVFKGFVQTDQGLAGQAAALSTSPVGGKSDRRATGGVGGDPSVYSPSPPESGGVAGPSPTSD